MNHHSDVIALIGSIYKPNIYLELGLCQDAKPVQALDIKQMALF